jgi:two-component system LytT family response regulator
MQPPIRALVVDDEPLARERVTTLLGRERDIELVGECADGIEAVAAIETHAPEVVFLDVQMPELNGVGVVDALTPGHRPEIVFVTAYDQHMERAFELHALDYLRKPYTDARFHDAVRHVRERVLAMRRSAHVDSRLSSLLAHLRHRERESERLTIRDAGTGAFHVLNIADIERIEAAGDSQVGIQVGKQSYLWRKTLAEVEARLDAGRFLRVHRSYVVNSTRITTVKPLLKGEYLLTLETGMTIRTGRSYRETVERFLAR